MPPKKYLTQKEIEELVNNWSNSEDDYDISNDDDSDWEAKVSLDRISDESEDSELDASNIQTTSKSETTENVTSLQNVDSDNDIEIAIPTCSKGMSKKSKLPKRDVVWKKGNIKINENQLKFSGNEIIPSKVKELDTPLAFFKYFFSDELIEKIVYESNLYACQIDPSKPTNFTSQDIRQFLGIILYMSLVHLPSVRLYWSHELGFPLIQNAMSRDQFEKIRKFIHLNDNQKHLPRDDPNHDRLHKLRPIIDILNNNFASIPFEEKLSIDEQMWVTKVRHYMKQYMPNKPHKWGFKLFVLRGISGYAYNFEVYSGQENMLTRPITEPDFGPSSNVVIRLSRRIPTSVNHKLYFDNYYTALPLMVHLANTGIHTLGTVRRNRIPGCKLPDENSLKAQDRGFSSEYIATVDGIDLSSLVWKDNKFVTMLSTFAGTNPVKKVNRFDRIKKKTIEIDCPYVIQEYNRHMGGVDLLDSLMARYKINIRSRKWYLRIFYHLLDLTVVNAWLLYKRVLNANGQQSEILPQSKFRAELAQSLCMVGSKYIPKRGRPSSMIEAEIQAKKHRGPSQYVPPKDVRLDQIGHMPVLKDKKMRCKLPNCKGYTFTKCEKCGVGLCFNRNNNCFKNFHTIH